MTLTNCGDRLERCKEQEGGGRVQGREQDKDLRRVASMAERNYSKVTVNFLEGVLFTTVNIRVLLC